MGVHQGVEASGGTWSFPLVQRHRLLGLAFGAMQSGRRGLGSDVAGSRPYHVGDDIDTIDWAASARLSSAVGRDEFVVRERFAEEAPRVVVVRDLSPGMGLFPDDLPWLSKPRAAAAAAELIALSGFAAQGLVGSLDTRCAPDSWQRPRGRAALVAAPPPPPAFDAPPEGLALALVELMRRSAELPSGSFVFVLSDFLHGPEADAWVPLVGRRLDVVPVVVQDAVWEQSFPDVGGTTVPVADPGTGRIGSLRLTKREAAARREENEARLVATLDGFARLGLDPVLLGTDDPDEVRSIFLTWAFEREAVAGQELRPWA
jgi:uncharacterized protein (DUF58 family)